MSDSTYLEAMNGGTPAKRPVWFMRQAGRCLPEYRKLKETYTFWQLAQTPELTTEVTLQPLRRFPLDAAILFSDIMTPLSPMGVDIDFKPGPVIAEPVRDDAAVDRLIVPEQGEIAPFVAEAIKMIRAETETPLIGFGGAPLTLAAYLIQGSGSKDYAQFRQMLRANPDAAHRLLDKVTETSVRYLRMQVESGAQAIQIFDSWAGLHSLDAFQEFSAPYVKRILDALKPLNVPRIYFATASGHLSDAINEFDCEGIGVDWRMSLAEARRRYGSRCVQGNLDPSWMLAPPERLKTAVDAVLADGDGAPHVFNLGHGMMKESNPDNIARVVDWVHEWGQ